MKRHFLITCLGSILALGPSLLAAEPAVKPQATFDRRALTANNKIAEAYAKHKSNLQVSGVGVVSKILADDTIGGRHQRFILRLSDGLNVLIAHNIDLAPKITALKEGDWVEFYGEYEWNPKGGVIHWTHKDPAGRHSAGWLRHKGQKYQ